MTVICDVLLVAAGWLSVPLWSAPSSAEIDLGAAERLLGVGLPLADYAPNFTLKCFEHIPANAP